MQISHRDSIEWKMDLTSTLTHLLSLSADERLEIASTLWNSLDNEAVQPLSPERQAELDRRIRGSEENPNDWYSWEEVLTKVEELEK